MTWQTSKKHLISNNEAGTLYELPILGFILMLAGIFLSSRHPGFLVLTGLGIIVLFLPSILDFLSRIKNRTEDRHLIALCAAEFTRRGSSPGLALRGNRSAGVVVFDSAAKQVAVAVPEIPIQIFDTRDLKTTLTQGEVSKLGGPKMLRYYMEFTLPGKKSLMLVFTSRRKAKRMFGKVKKITGDDAAVNNLK